MHPFAYLPQLDRVVVSQGTEAPTEEGEEGEEVILSSYYLVDPRTGATESVAGTFWPLEQPLVHPLQPTSEPGALRLWAARATEDGTSVGLYDPRTFTFVERTAISAIQFGAGDFWVDEPGNSIYLVYGGDLLRLPMAGASSQTQ
jgi:hypothetical protein